MKKTKKIGETYGKLENVSRIKAQKGYEERRWEVRKQKKQSRGEGMGMTKRPNDKT